MRKTMIIGIMALLSVMLVYGFADAKVGGRCGNCHTMHGYQGGVEITWLKGDPLDLDGPYGALLKGNCLGCHTAPTGTSDPYPSSGTYANYPFVASADDAFNDSNCLAGGFFPRTELGTGAHTGNAHTIGDITAPVGYPAGYTWYEGGARGLSCAGSAGCHGSQEIDDEMEAIKGGHHQTASFGYRILAAFNNNAEQPVDGGGDDNSGVTPKDYEKALIAAVSEGFGNRVAANTTHYHNIYKAQVDGNNTISQLCANCHGDFHDDTKGTAWLIHPTDFELPAYSAGPPVVMWEPDGDGVVNDRDAKYNPFGFTNVADTTTQKYVTCLSCHRAHGTAQYDLLRFTYTTGESGQQQAGRYVAGQEATTKVAYGCLGCHSGQR